MSKLRVLGFAISIDSYGAGASQDLQNPLGIGGPKLIVKSDKEMFLLNIT